jgi:hypothetical protein
MVIVEVSPGDGGAEEPPATPSAAPQLLQNRASSALLCPH